LFNSSTCTFSTTTTISPHQRTDACVRTLFHISLFTIKRRQRVSRVVYVGTQRERHCLLIRRTSALLPWRIGHIAAGGGDNDIAHCRHIGASYLIHNKTSARKSVSRAPAGICKRKAAGVGGVVAA